MVAVQEETGRIRETATHSSCITLQAILRSLLQTVVWNNDTIVCPVIPSAEDYGWKLDRVGWAPMMTTELPAPKAVLHLVRCGCKTQCALAANVNLLTLTLFDRSPIPALFINSSLVG